MTLQNQLTTLKDNWLITVGVIILVLLVVGFPGKNMNIMTQSASMMDESMMSKGLRGGLSPYNPYPEGDFAPDAEERKVVKTSYMSLALEHGTFEQSQQRLKGVVLEAEGYILNENVNEYGEKSKSYRRGDYTLKVRVDSYDRVVSQLKNIADVKAFTENAADITGRYTNTEIEIAAEEQRLQRYKEMYAAADRVEDQITLNDRIFEQERRIQYLKDSLQDDDKLVEYATIQVSLAEKEPAFWDLQTVRITELISNFVNSFMALIKFISYVLPWAIVLGIIIVVRRLFSRRY